MYAISALPEEPRSVSVLFNEPKLLKSVERVLNVTVVNGFSALQRAEIAEMLEHMLSSSSSMRFSALQRAEIAEMQWATRETGSAGEFQCSSTSRNC